MSLPATTHTFQPGMGRARFTPGSADALPAMTIKARWSGRNDDDDASATGTQHTHSEATTTQFVDVSPIAELHQALLQQKRVALAAIESDAADAASAPAAPAGFSPSAAQFPLLPLSSLATLSTPGAIGRCAVHTTPAAILAAASTTPCTLPSATIAASASASCAARSRCCLPRSSFWNTRCSCIFSALPDELLLFNVFSRLSSAELCAVASVCTRWKFLSTDRMLWRKVDLSPHARTVDNTVFDTLLSRVGPDLDSLKLCNLKGLDSSALRRLGEEHLAHNGGSLRSLHFCSLKAVDFEVMSSLLRGPGGAGTGAGSALRELSLFGCINIDDACVKLIRASCSRIEDLSLRGCAKITDAAFIVEEVIPSASSVREDNPSAEPESLLLESPHALCEGSRSSSVTSTASSFLSSAAVPSSRTFAPPLGSFAYLTSLNLANCKLLTEAGLIAAFRASPRLHKLNLHALNPTDQLLDALTLECPLIETLHLSSANPFGGNSGLTDAGVEFLASRLPRLSCLNLQGSARITDASLRMLVDSCRLLEKLNLGGCFLLTDAGVRTLSQADLPPSLTYPSRITHLSLFQCMYLTDASVELIANHMPSVQHLDMHSCAHISDKALDAIATPQQQPPPRAATPTSTPGSPSSNLSLHSHSASSDSIDSDLLHPESLSLSPPSPPRSLSPPPALETSCDSSAPLGPVYLLPNLQSLDVGACRKVSKDWVEALRAARPALAITHY